MTILTPDDLARCAAIANHRTGLIADLVREVAEATGVTAAAIYGQSRKAPIAEARQLVMFKARELGFSMPRIGRTLNRDHTTVLHGIRAEKKRRGIE